jgi:hypothetical protein
MSVLCDKLVAENVITWDQTTITQSSSAEVAMAVIVW